MAGAAQLLRGFMSKCGSTICQAVWWGGCTATTATATARSMGLTAAIVAFFRTQGYFVTWTARSLHFSLELAVARLSHRATRDHLSRLATRRRPGRRAGHATLVWRARPRGRRRAFSDSWALGSNRCVRTQRAAGRRATRRCNPHPCAEARRTASAQLKAPSTCPRVGAER